jgi:hypothetical protein
LVEDARHHRGISFLIVISINATEPKVCDEYSQSSVVQLDVMSPHLARWSQCPRAKKQVPALPRQITIVRVHRSERAPGREEHRFEVLLRLDAQER